MGFESVKALKGLCVTHMQPTMTVGPVRVLRDLNLCATVCVLPITRTAC